MLLSDIIRQVNRDVDDTFDSNDIRDWVNRCLDELTSIAQKQAKKTSSVTSSNTYSLPSDCHEIKHIFIDQEYFPIHIADQDSKGYKVWGDEFEIQGGPEEGTVTLYYVKKLENLVRQDQEPEIEREFHDLLVLYAISHSQYTDEEQERQMDAVNRYVSRKREYEQYCNRRNSEPYQVRTVY